MSSLAIVHRSAYVLLCNFLGYYVLITFTVEWWNPLRRNVVNILLSDIRVVNTDPSHNWKRQFCNILNVLSNFWSYSLEYSFHYELLIFMYPDVRKCITYWQKCKKNCISITECTRDLRERGLDFLGRLYSLRTLDQSPSLRFDSFSLLLSLSALSYFIFNIFLLFNSARDSDEIIMRLKVLEGIASIKKYCSFLFSVYYVVVRFAVHSKFDSVE